MAQYDAFLKLSADVKKWAKEVSDDIGRVSASTEVKKEIAQRIIDKQLFRPFVPKSYGVSRSHKHLTDSIMVISHARSVTINWRAKSNSNGFDYAQFVHDTPPRKGARRKYKNKTYPAKMVYVHTYPVNAEYMWTKEILPGGRKHQSAAIISAAVLEKEFKKNGKT